MMTNKYICCNKEYFLEITRRDNSKYYYKISEESIKDLKSTTWAVAIRKNGVYAYSMEKGLLHRFLLKASKNDVVDHINRCTFDNSISNLRITDYSINSLNSKRVKSNSGFRYIEIVKETQRKQKFAINVGKRYRCRVYTLKEAIQKRNVYIRENEPILWNIHKQELLQDEKVYEGKE